MGEYPGWICSECGRHFGRRVPDMATWHEGDACGWCGSDAVPVTEPRDFGYPPAPGVAVTRRRAAAAPTAHTETGADLSPGSTNHD